MPRLTWNTYIRTCIALNGSGIALAVMPNATEVVSGQLKYSAWYKETKKRTFDFIVMFLSTGAGYYYMLG